MNVDQLNGREKTSKYAWNMADKRSSNAYTILIGAHPMFPINANPNIPIIAHLHLQKWTWSREGNSVPNSYSCHWQEAQLSLKIREKTR
jgi:hypothetical protein